MSKARAVGSRYAREVCEFLVEALGPGIERRVDGGSRDRGDIAGLDIDGWVLECKREQKLDMATAINEAGREAANAGTPWFAGVCYRRMAGVGGSYVAMPLWVFRDVLVTIRRLRARVAELERQLELVP